MVVMTQYKVTTCKLGFNSGHRKFKVVIIALLVKVINSYKTCTNFKLIVDENMIQI